MGRGEKKRMLGLGLGKTDEDRDIPVRWWNCGEGGEGGEVGEKWESFGALVR